MTSRKVKREAYRHAYQWLVRDVDACEMDEEALTQAEEDECRIFIKECICDFLETRMRRLEVPE